MATVIRGEKDGIDQMLETGRAIKQMLEARTSVAAQDAVIHMESAISLLSQARVAVSRADAGRPVKR